MRRLLLGVNVDHVATVRQARRGKFPSPVLAALACEKAGADSIVCHLREDRRHIQDADVRLLRKRIKTRLNLEMSMAPDIVAAALKIKPDCVTLVPEKRQELTTEGGLDVRRLKARLRLLANRFARRGIEVSLFIDPVFEQLRAASAVGVSTIELHTGAYAEAGSAAEKSQALSTLKQAAKQAKRLGLKVAAGHGLDYDNVLPIARIREIEELNIGFSIVSRALFAGLGAAVRQMRAAMKR